MEGTKKIFVRTDDVAFFGPKKKKKGFLNPQKRENNTHDSHLVPHGSTKWASSSFASEFGMGSGALCSLWSFSEVYDQNTYLTNLPFFDPL